MESFSDIEHVLLFGSVALSTLLIARMVREGLHRIYLWFFLYAVASVAQTLLSLPFSSRPIAYAWIYFLTQPAVWLLYILIVLELYSLVLRNHKGIASLSRWTLMAGLGLSLVISLLTLLPDLRQAPESSPVLVYYTIIERGIVSSLVVFLLLMLLFLIWYPIPLSRNILLHSVVYCLYFLSTTLTLFVRNMTGLEHTRTISTILIGVSTLCLLAWVLLFNRAGEARTVTVGHQWRPEDEQRLVEQLDAINATLLRSSNK